MTVMAGTIERQAAEFSHVYYEFQRKYAGLLSVLKKPGLENGMGPIFQHSGSFCFYVEGTNLNNNRNYFFFTKGNISVYPAMSVNKRMTKIRKMTTRKVTRKSPPAGSRSS